MLSSALWRCSRARYMRVSSTDDTCFVRTSSARWRTGQSAASSRFAGRFSAGALLTTNGLPRPVHGDAGHDGTEVIRRRHVVRDGDRALLLQPRERGVGAVDERLAVVFRQFDARQLQRVGHHRQRDAVGAGLLHARPEHARRERAAEAEAGEGGEKATARIVSGHDRRIIAAATREPVAPGPTRHTAEGSLASPAFPRRPIASRPSRMRSLTAARASRHAPTA